MKALVTGAAGFIGSHLTESLLGSHDEVIGVDSFTDYYPKPIKLANLNRNKDKDGFKFVEADLATYPVSELVRGVDIVFHLAAQPGVRASWGDSFSYYVRDNISATQRLLEACKDSGVKRLVYASSSSIYGDAERMPTPEETVPRPVSPYGATKLEAEYLCEVYRKNYGIPTVILRYFTVFGPRQRPDMAFNRFIHSMLNDRPIELYGDGNQGRDFTFVTDTVAGTILATQSPVGSVYNVGTGRAVTVNEVLAILGKIVGKEPRRNLKLRAQGDVLNTCADNSKIREELNFRPEVEIEAGLRRQVDHQKSTA